MKLDYEQSVLLLRNDRKRRTTETRANVGYVDTSRFSLFFPCYFPQKPNHCSHEQNITLQANSLTKQWLESMQTQTSVLAKELPKQKKPAGVHHIDDVIILVDK